MIRTVNQADASAIAALAVDSGLFSAEEAEVIRTMMVDYFSRGQQQGHACLLDLDEQQAVGVAYYQPAVATDRAWYLTLIAVAGGRQGQGRGSVLLRQVEDELRGRGERLLLVETSGLSSFSRTREFYATRGYTEEARVRDYYEDGDDMVLFRKDLAN